MFELVDNSTNRKIFNIKKSYSNDESFNYILKVHNHISKTGFSLNMVDESHWTSGITNVSELSVGDKVIFNDDITNNINVIDENTFIFNNIIQISGVNYTFYPTDNINYLKCIKLNDVYITIFDDESGNFTIIQSDGSSETYQFSSNPVKNLSIIGMNNTIIIGYYDTILEKSYLKEINIGSLTQYTPIFFHDGEAKYIKINKINDEKFILTYQTSDYGIIQIVKISDDHILSFGYPFIFNDDLTLFSDSVYQSDNVVVIFYDLDEQLKIKNCRIYDDYIGVGLPKIIKDNYCYDLNIQKFDNNYVYCSYYDAETIKIELSLIKIDNDITIIQQDTDFSDWNEGLDISTLNDTQFVIAYMDNNYNGVYRIVDFIKSLNDTLYCDYNEFYINLNEVNCEKNIGHNDYWIYYDNQIVEKGVVKIKN